MNAQIKGLERDIRTRMRAHPDGRIFLSLFRSQASVITAAELLAEIGDCRERYPPADALAADAGQAGSPSNRRMEDRRIPQSLQQTTTRRVLPPRRQQPPLAPLGAHPLPQARQRGHEHPRAIRTVGRAWCRVVWQCWRNHTTHDPTQHRAPQRHITVNIPTASGPITDQEAARATEDPVSGDRTSPHPRSVPENPTPSPDGRRLTQDVYGDVLARADPRRRAGATPRFRSVATARKLPDTVLAASRNQDGSGIEGPRPEIVDRQEVAGAVEWLACHASGVPTGHTCRAICGPRLLRLLWRSHWRPRRPRGAGPPDFRTPPGCGWGGTGPQRAGPRRREPSWPGSHLAG